MFTLRCTGRLSKRVHFAAAATSPPTTTRLGDWYANVLHVGRLQLVLAMSDETLLPVVVAAAPYGTLAARLRPAVTEVLAAIGIAPAEIERERVEMNEIAYGKTVSRQVLGVMVDLAKGVPFYLGRAQPARRVDGAGGDAVRAAVCDDGHAG